ncbi:MAG: hypothetical protein ACPIOQ_24505, partial [Promethearchaeia archaeon]
PARMCACVDVRVFASEPRHKTSHMADAPDQVWRVFRAHLAAGPATVGVEVYDDGQASDLGVVLEQPAELVISPDVAHQRPRCRHTTQREHQDRQAQPPGHHCPSRHALESGRWKPLQKDLEASSSAKLPRQHRRDTSTGPFRGNG